MDGGSAAGPDPPESLDTSWRSRCLSDGGGVRAEPLVAVLALACQPRPGGELARRLAGWDCRSPPTHRAAALRLFHRSHLRSFLASLRLSCDRYIALCPLRGGVPGVDRIPDGLREYADRRSCSQHHAHHLFRLWSHRDTGTSIARQPVPARLRDPPSADPVRALQPVRFYNGS